MPTSWGRRLTALVAAGGAIALAVLAVQSTAWLVTSSGSGFGLRVLETCSEHGCDAKPIGDVVAEVARATPQLVQSGFVEAGVVAFSAIWVAAGALALALLPALAGARWGLARVVSQLGLVALVVALGAAVVFVMRRPGGAGAYALGQGFWLFGAGNVVGLVAGQMLAKLHAPGDPG